MRVAVNTFFMERVRNQVLGKLYSQLRFSYLLVQVKIESLHVLTPE